jgi:glutamate/aspartate transport system substrate-binding protein
MTNFVKGLRARGIISMAAWAKIAAGVCVASLMGLAGASAEGGATLRKIAASGVIAIGYSERAIPFSFLDAEKKPTGFALDLCAAVAERVKEKLRLPEIKIEYKPAAGGGADLDCSAAPKTAELASGAGVSAPIYIAELKWIAPARLRVETENERTGRKRHETKTPATVDDLKNKTIALTKDSPAAKIVLALCVERMLGLSIQEEKSAGDAFKLIETGQASAVIDDDAVLLGLKANARRPSGFTIFGEAYSGAAYVLAFRKDDAAFKALVDGAIGDAMRSGEYEKLYAKWFESPIPPRNVNLAHPMPAALKKLVDATRAATN